MSGLPKKLKRDAIAEAICEVRFECEESSSVPEIVVGRLAEFQEWREFIKKRLPASDIPAPIRASNPDLRNTPILQFSESSGSKRVKIGWNVLSFHRLAPYPGWSVFESEIKMSLDFLFSSFKDFKANRLGFRYVNIFTEKDHGVKSVSALNYSVCVAGLELAEPQNLNYQRIRSDKHIVQVRVASPEYVSGSRELRALVDLDVFTAAGVEILDADSAHEWIREAHIYEKEEFFMLFTEDMKNRLVEVW